MAEDESLHCAKMPRNLRIGRYRLEFEPGLRFGLSNGMRGVSRCRTPWGAWFALRRWMRTPVGPVE